MERFNELLCVNLWDRLMEFKEAPLVQRRIKFFHLRDRHAESVNVSSKTGDGKSVSARWTATACMEMRTQGIQSIYKKPQQWPCSVFPLSIWHYRMQIICQTTQNQRSKSHISRLLGQSWSNSVKRLRYHTFPARWVFHIIQNSSKALC